MIDSESWSSISTLNEEAPSTQEPEVEVEAPVRNLLDIFSVGGFGFSRRNTINDLNPMSVIDKFRQGVAANKKEAQEQQEEEDDPHLEDELDADENDGSDDDDSVESDVEESTGRLADEDSEDLTEKESSVKSQDLSVSEIMDGLKEAMTESSNNTTLDTLDESTSTANTGPDTESLPADDVTKSAGTDTGVSDSTELHGGDSTKSFDTAVSEFETLDMDIDAEVEFDMESAQSHMADAVRNGTDGQDDSMIAGINDESRVEDAGAEVNGVDGEDYSSSSTATIEIQGTFIRRT